MLTAVLKGRRVQIFTWGYYQVTKTDVWLVLSVNKKIKVLNYKKSIRFQKEFYLKPKRNLHFQDYFDIETS